MMEFVSGYSPFFSVSFVLVAAGLELHLFFGRIGISFVFINKLLIIIVIVPEPS